MTTDSLSFPEAIAATQYLMEQITVNQLDEITIEQKISTIVNSKTGARGFFVAYLTSEIPLADFPSVGVINGLKSANDLVTELLVKNLAMSSAMTITHTLNNDIDNLEGSRKVSQRTSNLIKHLQLHSLTEELQKLESTIVTGNGDYKDFLTQWNYDPQQQQEILKAIANTLKSQNDL
ncbi:hypothetical protein NIES4102_00020 [Chondrocystis sp. NIES-4102]|nr:hypothetical protein NIES4102_00020 [Chondrocystis sp. NIES-4102]